MNTAKKTFVLQERRIIWPPDRLLESRNARKTYLGKSLLCSLLTSTRSAHTCTRKRPKALHSKRQILFNFSKIYKIHGMNNMAVASESPRSRFMGWIFSHAEVITAFVQSNITDIEIKIPCGPFLLNCSMNLLLFFADFVYRASTYVICCNMSAAAWGRYQKFSDWSSLASYYHLALDIRHQLTKRKYW